MSATLAAVKALVARGDALVSAHGYDELAADDILSTDVLKGIETAELVEDYPNAAKGPSVLVLQKDTDDRPIHVVWGIPKGLTRPAVLVTAYRWSGDFMERT